MKPTLADLAGQRALTLTQPWATAIFIGLKQYETRSWTTRYCGPLLIHAAKGYPAFARAFWADEWDHGRGRTIMPFGAIIGRVTLVDVQATFPLSQNLTSLERLYGDYSRGRYAWKFESPVRFEEPVPCAGHLGIWQVG